MEIYFQNHQQKFGDVFKITSVPFFISNFNLLSCKLDNFRFKVLYWVILFWYYIEQNKIVEHAVWSKTIWSETLAKSYNNIHNTFTVLCEKSKTVSFASSIMKNIVPFSARSRFPINLICCIAFGSASSACWLLKSVAIIL